MYIGSDEFNNAIENTQGNAPKIRVTLEDGTTLGNIKSAKFYGGSNDSDDISIGTTNMARIDVTAFTDRLLTNNEIFLEQGIELADGVVEYMPIGYFTVQKPSGDIDEVTFTAYDRMQKFEKPYSSSLVYPTTSTLILDELCQICGIELATPLDNTIEVTENLKGYTCREVLGYIASMHGYFACIDRYGRLNLRWYSNTPIEKSLKKIWHFEKSQDNFEIAKVEIAKDSEINYVSGDGITTLHNSNPLATQEITNDVFAKLGGFAYSVGEVEMLDDARLDPWDMVSVEYYDGKTYNIPCMTLEHDFKAYSTTVKSVGKSESENEYRFTGPTIQYLNRMATELLVANRVIATKVDAEYVNSVAITTENFDAKVAEIKELVVEEIDGKYASIDLANIDIANIGRFYADSGLLKDVVIVDGHITGVLDAVTINANNITSGTLTTDRLVIRGTDKSIVYELNNIDGALQSKDVDTLNGEIITPRTINADRIVAESITSNEIATNAITSEKIVSHAITADKLNVDSLSAINANLGTVTAGVIQSSNYKKNVEGMQLDLTQGVWEGKYFNIDNEGKMSATGGKIGGWEIIDTGLRYGNGTFAINIGPPSSDNDEIVLSLATYDEGLGSYVEEGYIGYNGKGFPYIYMYEYMGTLLEVQQIDASIVTANYIQTKKGADLDTINGDYISRTSGSNLMGYDYECHVIGTYGGSFVYAKFATVRVVNPYSADAPIRFQIIHRGGCGDVWLSISGGNTVESHTIAGLEQNGALGVQIYAVTSSPGVFDLYMAYPAWEYASVTRLEMSSYMRGQVTVEWKKEFVSSLPSGYIEANRHFNQSYNKASFRTGAFGSYDNTGMYALTTSSFQCNSWVRTNGATGWYNETYSGGLYMIDTAWVRTYANKNFYCDATIQASNIQTDAGANLDTLAGILSRLFIPENVDLQFYKTAWKADNTETYGITMRLGNSRMGTYVDDTYYLTIDYTGALRVGCQINGAAYPTWYEK